jgi:hypothetical protein
MAGSKRVIGGDFEPFHSGLHRCLTEIGVIAS